MRWLCLAVLLLRFQAFGQTRVEEARIPPALKTLLEDRDGRQSLKCEVHPLKPTLNFGFRFQSGYVVQMPLEQFLGSGHKLALAVKITPETSDASPVYLVNRIDLPEVPKTKALAEFGGGYLLGEGRYNVQWTLVDERERVCRKSWTMEAELGRNDRKVKLAMPPNAIAELSLRRPTRKQADLLPLRMTVLLHAAPVSPRRTKLRTGDTLLLLGSLSSLLDQFPARSVRLVVFNLDQQNEIFRQEDFAPEHLDRVVQSINQLELGLIDYRVLQNPRGHLGILADLINKELEASPPSDAVVFLGPASRYLDKLPESSIAKSAENSPKFFYFQFHPYFRRNSGLPDSIQSAVSRLKGKVSIIYTPGEFAKAIEQLGSRVSGLR
jgi:hypothetical protein